MGTDTPGSLPWIVAECAAKRRVLALAEQRAARLTTLERWYREALIERDRYRTALERIAAGADDSGFLTAQQIACYALAGTQANDQKETR